MALADASSNLGWDARWPVRDRLGLGGPPMLSELLEDFAWALLIGSLLPWAPGCPITKRYLLTTGLFEESPSLRNWRTILTSLS